MTLKEFFVNTDIECIRVGNVSGHWHDDHVLDYIVDHQTEEVDEERTRRDGDTTYVYLKKGGN